MRRRILLPTDFSDNSWAAIGYALKLFAGQECRFYILNSIALHASTMSNFSNSLMRIMKDNATKELQDFKEEIELANANAKHSFQIALSTMDIIDAIKASVLRDRMDFIVMGTKGATGAKELFIGSNTVKVIKGIKDCPVLVVPEEFDFVPLRQIAFPTDYKRAFKEKELSPIKVLAELYNSKIRILHINTEEALEPVQEKNYNTLKIYLGDYDHSFHWMPDYSSKAIEIRTFIEDLEIDLLAMISYKHSCIEKIVNEPVIKKIGYKPEVPFLVVPA